jgi:hypothetical protein
MLIYWPVVPKFAGSTRLKPSDFSLPMFIQLGNICVLCITFCDVKLNNVGDKESLCFSPVLFSKKDYNVPSILTALLVFCLHV